MSRMVVVVFLDCVCVWWEGFVKGEVFTIVRDLSPALAISYISSSSITLFQCHHLRRNFSAVFIDNNAFYLLEVG